MTQHTHRKKRLIIAIILGLIAAAIITSVVLWSIRYTPPQVSQEVVSQAQREADAYFARQQAAAPLQGTQPIGRLAYNTCYMDHQDAGWTIRSYVSTCFLTFVTIHQPDTSKQSYQHFERQLTSPKELMRRIPLEDSYTSSPDGRVRVVGQAYLSYPGKLLTPEYVKETIISQAGNVVTYAKQEAVDNTKTIEEGWQGEFQPQQRPYLIYVWSQRYHHQKVGCRQPHILFCERP